MATDYIILRKNGVMEVLAFISKVLKILGD